mmetsp:Transcript_19035/g.41465  ORF Transcript_19035/g.41465 Transcript_19035/m.41465 type:complete len:264 (+) Transcript_19035:218-1009(+)
MSPTHLCYRKRVSPSKRHHINIYFLFPACSVVGLFSLLEMIYPLKFLLALRRSSSSFFFRSASFFALAARLASIFLANSASLGLMAFLLDKEKGEADLLAVVIMPNNGLAEAALAGATFFFLAARGEVVLLAILFFFFGAVAVVAALLVPPNMEKAAAVFAAGAFGGFGGLVLGGLGFVSDEADGAELELELELLLVTTDEATSARSPKISPHVGVLVASRYSPSVRSAYSSSSTLFIVLASSNPPASRTFFLAAMLATVTLS